MSLTTDRHRARRERPCSRPCRRWPVCAPACAARTQHRTQADTALEAPRRRSGGRSVWLLGTAPSQAHPRLSPHLCSCGRQRSLPSSSPYEGTSPIPGGPPLTTYSPPIGFTSRHHHWGLRPLHVNLGMGRHRRSIHSSLGKSRQNTDTSQKDGIRMIDQQVERSPS